MDIESNITQTLVSIQGEGYGLGEPILLIRFEGCNLNCTFCDTKWSLKVNKTCHKFKWKSGNETHNITTTPFHIDSGNIDEYIEYIYSKFLSKYVINTVLFTGGEPFVHVEFMEYFIHMCNKMEYFEKYEIETNGVGIYKNLEFIISKKSLIQLNISPKQTEYNALYDIKFKQVLELINTYINSEDYNNIDDSFLKFVYHKDLEKDILGFIKKFKPKSIPIYLTSMTPQNGTENFLEVYKENCLATLEFCLKTGYRYSPREHVFLFGDNREEFESCKK